ncbi:hypothetical protein FRACYDRAFT_241558 [Fragilariopsis cylindrus CCMP1102]|uniref:CST complex subunit Stn1 N-terminal domain-containing protein n=1 Tax=Fragilariopsis cylindrus CCMP1102 TaxID=635003 RepID=A0A1E7F5T3_9STRA|nr:hypothetical protein FRACYDRAFT_241558 [Fragilariopsis cylindrus CCMP1102]|eukprot:OEU13223.1 hypothetical protein FRACYDRAFT_241558 [Fragilariopsis cylindrus CCMP1102]
MTELLDNNTKLDFVAGISPQYWSYVPMSVMDVLNLKLKDGINWMIIHDNNNNNNDYNLSSKQKSLSDDKDGNDNDNGRAGEKKNEFMLSPISRCLLVGYIVYKSQRRDGSMIYILDDGTGLIDCVHWLNNYSNNNDTQQDIYHLPSLNMTGGDNTNDQDDDYTDDAAAACFSVGDPVRIFGKIECLASISKTQKNKEMNSEGRGNHKHNHNGYDNDNNVHYIVREIHTSLIERFGSLGSLGNINSCLDNLGPQIQSQINNKINLPAADDIYTCSWRVFGTNCCCNLSYMDDMLYCHCQCKVEPLDPSYHFRDAILHILQSMQARTTERLQFIYKQIRNNEQLQTLASREIIVVDEQQQHDTTTKKKNTLIDRLFLKTFSALRNDGIVCLLNTNTDEYLLITRDKVLEPYIRNQIDEKKKNNKRISNYISYENSPPYISRVLHNERLLYIKRLIQQQDNEKN